MTITSQIIQKLNDDMVQIQKGLQPEQLAFWYQKIISETKDMAPPWLQDKIPYTTQLYFLKVQEIMALEMDKTLV